MGLVLLPYVHFEIFTDVPTYGYAYDYGYAFHMAIWLSIALALAIGIGIARLMSMRRHARIMPGTVTVLAQWRHWHWHWHWHWHCIGLTLPILPVSQNISLTVKFYWASGRLKRTTKLNATLVLLHTAIIKSHSKRRQCIYRDERMSQLARLAI